MLLARLAFPIVALATACSAPAPPPRSPVEGRAPGGERPASPPAISAPPPPATAEVGSGDGPGQGLTDANAPPPPSAAEVRARRRGAATARRDLAAGRTRLLFYGYRDGRTLRFVDLLRAELGVEARFVAGCVVDGAVVARADGYNDVVVHALEARHGRGILDRLEERVERELSERR